MALSNAVLLANIASRKALTVDSTNDRVGIGSTTPDVTLDVIGIISATSFSGDGSLLTNVGFDTSYISGIAATFTGNVTVGGVLTYEDVANVDSVGLITAQSGVRVLAGGVGIADSIFHLSDDNTRIRFPAADTFTVETAGSERVRIDSSGRSTFSGESASTSGPQYSKLQVLGNTFAETTGLFSLRRNEVFGDITAGEDLGVIHFADRTGNTFAEIHGTCDGTTGSSDYPGRLAFYTTADGASSTTERLRIGSSGQIGLGGANYGTAGQVLQSNGSGSAVTWEDASGGGITTEAQVKTTGQTALLTLSSAVDHKVTCTGTVTIDVTGGTLEGESHTLRIVNNGTATVGFSTHFLFPSGSVPSLPTADGTISLISFTIHRAGSTGISTQLLSGSSVNYS